MLPPHIFKNKPNENVLEVVKVQNEEISELKNTEKSISEVYEEPNENELLLEYSKWGNRTLKHRFQEELFTSTILNFRLFYLLKPIHNKSESWLKRILVPLYVILVIPYSIFVLPVNLIFLVAWILILLSNKLHVKAYRKKSNIGFILFQIISSIILWFFFTKEMTLIVTFILGSLLDNSR